MVNYKNGGFMVVSRAHCLNNTPPVFPARTKLHQSFAQRSNMKIIMQQNE